MSVSTIREIRPYNWCGLLVFDDPDVGLDKEPFVAGVPEILYDLCHAVGIKSPKNGFKLLFSDEEFAGYHIKAIRLYEENGGWWYKVKGENGWLCPAMFQYFTEAPEHIFIKVDSL